MEAANHRESESGHEKLVVKVDKKLLEAMVQFKDPKKEKAYAGRVAKGKKAKSGKRLHLPFLQKMESDEKFLSYIKAISFKWLLEHSVVEVPVDLAKEFFTSFQFKTTTDLYTIGIRFRVFNREMVMSLLEWSWRMGLISQEEEEREWDKREIGPPEFTEGFDVDEAWSLITHERAGQFRTRFSKGDQITDPVLRLAQVFLAYNLLGQANPTITTSEVYFMWCMLKGIKVHLGYWISHACHTITTSSCPPPLRMPSAWSQHVNELRHGTDETKAPSNNV